MPVDLLQTQPRDLLAGKQPRDLLTEEEGIGTKALGVVEGVMNFASGMVAGPAAGLAGIGSVGTKATGLTEKDPGDVVRNVAEGLTYAPRTETGKDVAGVLNWPFEKLMEGIHYVGEKTFDVTDSPATAALTEGGLAAGAALLTGRMLKGKKSPKTIEAEPKPVEPTIAEVVAEKAAPRDLAAEFQYRIQQGQESVKPSPEGVMPPPAVRADVPKSEPLFKQQMAPETSQKIADLAKDFFDKNPNLRRQNEQITDTVRRYIWSDDISLATMDKYGLKPQHFADELRLAVSDAGKTLNHMSQVAKHASPEQLQILKEAGFNLAEAQLRPMWRRATDLWRASLVTQVATSVRNLASQGIRVGVDAITDSMDAGIQRAMGLPKKTAPLDGFEVLLQLTRRNKAATSKILDRLPSERERLFSNYLSDVNIPKNTMVGTALEKTMGTLEKGVYYLNIFNRTQEFIIRRAVFQARLAQYMRREGGSLKEAIKNNDWDAIPDEGIKYATDKALHATFASSPEHGTVAKAIVDVINKVPTFALVVPFPRFLANAIKFQYQHSPMGILHYLSKSERAAFAAGDVHRMSKAIVGSAMLYAAFEFRDSKYAGERWYEAKDPETGKIIDLRPYNPFVAYLFIADVVKRTKEGSLYKLRTQDIAQGVFSTNLRAGTGLYILDHTLQSFLGAGNDDAKLEQKIKEISGEYASGFLTPLAQLRDIYDEITQGRQTSKDTRQESFLGPLKRQIPGVSQTLPDQTYPTRSGPKVNPQPALRQATGLSISEPKNVLESELDRLGFEYQEILRATGDRPLDRQYRQALGTVLEKVGADVINSDGYKNAEDTRKAVIMEQVLKETRKEVISIINSRLPIEKQLERAIQKLSPRLRIFVQDKRKNK